MPLMEAPKPAAPIMPDDVTRDFYVEVMRTLDRAGVSYLVGGGYAMAHYTGIARNTKDLDLFVRPGDHKRVLETAAAAGFQTEYFYPFWIAKILQGDAFTDILYNSGNGLCPVDDDWFDHSIETEILGYRTRLVPAEEQLWSKAFVQDRDRYDGADVAHLILAQGQRLDWRRLVRHFAGHEAVLLAHLILYGYVYPCDRDRVPEWVAPQLSRAAERRSTQQPRVCRGTFISQKSYLAPIRAWGYLDGRLQPHGPLTREELDQLPRE